MTEQVITDAVILERKKAFVILTFPGPVACLRLAKNLFAAFFGVSSSPSVHLPVAVIRAMKDLPAFSSWPCQLQIQSFGGTFHLGAFLLLFPGRGRSPAPGWQGRLCCCGLKLTARLFMPLARLASNYITWSC